MIHSSAASGAVPPVRPHGRDLTKRMLDLLGSALLLVALMPLLFAIGVAVRCSLGKPVLYTQVRPGRYGVPFRIVKFRSMRDVDTMAGVVSDEQRLTPFGRALRSTSLDELPELWNVLRGEMSFVGPRPLLVEYLDRYTQHQARRHEVRPGITGLAQIHGRNAMPWDERLDLDVAYVDTRTIWLDAKILLRTLATVARRQGTTAPGHPTMPEFTGTSAATP